MLHCSVDKKGKEIMYDIEDKIFDMLAARKCVEWSGMNHPGFLEKRGQDLFNE